MGPVPSGFQASMHATIRSSQNATWARPVATVHPSFIECSRSSSLAFSTNARSRSSATLFTSTYDRSTATASSFPLSSRTRCGPTLVEQPRDPLAAVDQPLDRRVLDDLMQGHGQETVERPPLFGVVDRLEEAGPDGALDRLVVPGDRLDAGARREGQHQLLAARLELAGRPVEPVGHDALQRRVDALAGERRARLARGADRERPGVRGSVRELERDQAGGPAEQRDQHPDRDPAIHAPHRLRNTRIGTSASAANSAQNRNDGRKVRVTARSIVSTKSSCTCRTASSVPAPAASNAAAKSGISPFGARSSSSRMSRARGIFVVPGISPSMITAVAFSFATSAPARRSPASNGAPMASASTRPRWRTPTVSVVFGAIAPSPPSTAWVRPGTASPSPNPHSANDPSVYPRSLDGRNASPINPAASNTAPEAIPSAAGSWAASGRASRVAAGIALTTAAPWIGVSPNTSITSRTPRNSVPTRAPESNASATLPGTVRHRLGRHPSRRIAATCAPNVASSAAPATGAWKTKMARQSNSWVSTPPSAGPTAAPNVPASVQIATPRAVEPASAARTGSEPASSSAPPRPWTERAAIRNPIESASAQAIDAARNRTVPAARSRLARAWCTTTTSASAQIASTRLYEVITHATPSIVVSKRAYSSGSASTTIDESANATATATATAATRNVRRVTAAWSR